MDQNRRLALSLCKDIEERCADIYFFFAQLFAADQDIASLWDKTAHEELNHANIIKLAMNCRDLDLAPVAPDLSRHREFERSLRQQLATLRNEPPALAAALQVALDLEKRLLEFHLLNVAVFQNAQERKLFEVLSGSDKTHLSALEAAAAKWEEQ